MPTPEDVEAVLRVVLWEGLGLRPNQVPDMDVKSARRTVANILRTGESPRIVIAVARHGMPHVWPFSEGQAWDAFDLKKNYLKAKGVVGRAHRRSEIPVDPHKIAKLQEEDDGNQH